MRRQPSMRGDAASLWQLTLLLLLAALSTAVKPSAAQAAVINLADLRAAAFSGGVYVVNANIQLAGALSLNGTNTSLTLLGNTAACGGLCTLDANHTGGHFVVSMGYTLTVDSIAFVNSVRGGPATDPCLGGVVRGAQIGDSLTVSRNCAPGQLGTGYTTISHLNDLPCGFLRCSSIIVAANASLFVANSLFANNTGNAGQFGAMGAAISIVATADFSIRDTQFINNIVQDFAGGSWGNSGGAISIDQPFSAMVYPIAFTDAPDVIHPDPSSFPSSPHIVQLMQILNCTFSQNQASRGGALFLALNAGTLDITGSTFDGNVAMGTFNWLSALGGAIYAHEYTNSRPFKALIGDYSGTTTPEIRFPLHPHYVITDCVFLNNAARPKIVFLAKGTPTVASKGGAVAAQSGGYGISFVRCHFSGNTATNGGALFYSGNSRTNDVFLWNEGLFDISQVNDYFKDDYRNHNGYFHEDYARVQTVGSADYLSLAPYAEETTYLLRIDNCNFADNTASSGVAAATGGAAHIDCGTAVISGSLFSGNSIVSTGTSFDALNSGGAVFATNDCLTADAAHLLTTNLTVLDSTFVSNQAYASGAAVASRNRVYPGSGLQGGTIELAFVGCSFEHNVGTQLGGALYLDVTSHATLLRCNLTSNAALQGGAVYALGGAMQHAFTDSVFQSNAATLGGAVAIAGDAVIATTACSFTSNVAINGSGIALLADAALYSDGGVYSGNTASSYGGAVFCAGNGTNATLSASVILTRNTASIGAGVFSESSLSVPPSAAGHPNQAANFGPDRATLPASYQLYYSRGLFLPLVGAAVTFQSGIPLNLSLQMLDSYSQRVSFWPDLVADVQCLSCGASTVTGNAHAVYFSSSAAFSTLAVSGFVNSTAVLGLTLSSPSIPIFGSAGVTVNISVTIAACAALQVFEDLRCVCAPGAFLDGPTQSCQLCAVGLISTATGSTACTKCPPRFAWVNSSLCSPCPDSSITSPGNPAQCACSSGFYDSHFNASLAAPVCKACPLGGACSTGLVGAAAGYWRENERSDAFVQCREGNCLAETVMGPLSMLAAPAAGNRTLGAGLNCVEGNGGPLCGVCVPGNAMQSGVCAPCDPADAWDNWSHGSKAGLLIGCIIFALITLGFLFFQPLVPSLERSAAAIGSALKEAPSYVFGRINACCCCCFVKRTQAAAATDAKGEESATTASEDGKRAPGEESQAPGDDSANKQGGVEKNKKDDDAATNFARNGNAASAVGNMAAFMGGDDGGSGGDEEEEEEGSGSGGGVEGNLDFFDWLEEFLEKMEKVTKIMMNFYQIVSTFLKSLDIPWPNIFGVVMARVNVVNLNLVQLPAAACLNPSPSFYKQFNGYTLGLVFALLFSVAMWMFGSRVVARVSLRGMPEEERATRLTHFRSTVISRVLLVLYVTYPGVSVTIFGIFSCTTLPVSGTSYLDADMSIQCYDREHWKYVAAGVVWLFVVPVGVPAFFLYLLRRFHVPQLAALVSDNAFLHEAIKLAWTEGLAQPSESHKLTVDSITDVHLEALYALLVKELPADEASDILAGTKAPVEEQRAEELESQELAKEGTVARARRLSLLATARAKETAKDAATSIRCSGSIFVKGAALSPAAARRVFLLRTLLHWCRTAGRVEIAPLHWQTLESLHAYTQSPQGLAAADDAVPANQAAELIKLSSNDVAYKVKYALGECGFLFSAYRVDCWYWEVVELIRKLMLTSILALIAPGSAGQVVAGLLIAFVLLFINVKMKPYASDLLNFVSVISQVNLFCFLLVALLLKVNLDGEGGSGFFSFIVGFLSLVPIVLPIVIKLVIRAYGNMESRMLVKDNTFA